MEINGKKFSCPYWKNKIRNGKVIIRGFLNGKGESRAIRSQLENLLYKKFKNGIPEAAEFVKFAKRERIGIDCSGLVYRLLDRLLKLGYKQTKYGSLDELFHDKIDKTNVLRLTAEDKSLRIDDYKKLEYGDMIRMMRGKHLMFITDTDDEYITYVHASNMTKTQGVHTGKIQIINAELPLENQKWQESTRKGNSFNLKYYHPDEGDGIYRLRIFS